MSTIPEETEEQLLEKSLRLERIAKEGVTAQEVITIILFYYNLIIDIFMNVSFSSTLKLNNFVNLN